MILQTDILERLNYVKKTGDRSTPTLVPISSVQTIPQLMEIYSPAALSLFLEEDALTMSAAAKVQVFVEQDELDIETALEEALRLGILNRAADMVKQVSDLEKSIVKVYMDWKRLTQTIEGLLIDTGTSTPNINEMLELLNALEIY